MEELVEIALGGVLEDQKGLGGVLFNERFRSDGV